MYRTMGGLPPEQTVPVNVDLGANVNRFSSTNNLDLDRASNERARDEGCDFLLKIRKTRNTLSESVPNLANRNI